MKFPFTYPASPLIRQHGPQGYTSYESYRPWLRDEFVFRCVYCLDRECWRRTAQAFEIDHFLPIASHPGAELKYENLLYSCAACNAAKGSQELPNPAEVLLDERITVDDDGRIFGHSPQANKIIRQLGLDSPEYVEYRRLCLDILALAAKFDADLYRRFVGFPEDLPNLSVLRPPGGNSHPEGIARSHFARHHRGELGLNVG